MMILAGSFFVKYLVLSTVTKTGGRKRRTGPATLHSTTPIALILEHEFRSLQIRQIIQMGIAFAPFDTGAARILYAFAMMK